jgi:amidase
MTASKTVHAFGDDALADHDATALAALLRQGELSVAEVTAAAIARARRLQPLLNAVEAENFEAALRAAGTPPAQGRFAGVPTFVKDNTDIEGLPTRQGSAAIPARPSTHTNAFAKQFLAQGFVLLGKSSLPEFGFNASTEFMHRAPTRNPWHTDYSAGASSGGAAALVAAGVVPIAHANDGGGSIRIPAAACGLVGLKPTRGRHLDSEAARSLPINIVSEGVVTRSVRDTANFMAGLEQHWRNPALPPVGQVNGPGQRRLRIGMVLDSVTGPSDAETRDTVLATARLLESMGHRVSEIPLPIGPRFADDFAMYWGLISFLVSTFGHRVIHPEFDKRQLDNLTRGLAGTFRQNFLKTPFVLYRLKKLYKEYAENFRSYDLILTPVLAHTTPLLGHLSPTQDFDELFTRLRRYVAFTPLNNAAGSPAIALPMGATKTGLPVAVHFSAAHGDERTLLEIAFELEEAQPWRRIQAAG